MSIVKQLQNDKNKLIAADKQNEVLKSVKLLMDGDHTEDLRIANALGRNHSIAVGQANVGKKLELEKLDATYAGGVYKIEFIKNLCLKYNMRFLKSKYFAGHLDVSAIHKIKEFSKETGVEITDGNLNSNFFILAPEEAFKLNAERLPRTSDDPAIFYRIDGGHYRLIHKWGSDFTIFRRVKGLFNRSVRSRYWTLEFLYAFALSFLLVSLHSMVGASLYFLLLLPISFGIAAIHMAIQGVWDLGSSDREKIFSSEGWNSEKRYYQ